MFAKISNRITINTDHIVWIAKDDEQMTVKMSDGTEYDVEDSRELKVAMNYIFKAARHASF